jgi:hypothetical protein
MKNIGYHQYRFKDNPLEEEFALAWDKENRSYHHDLIGYLLNKDNLNNPKIPSQKEREDAATVIQWLGSPCGQFFLSQLGYEKVK